MSILELGALGEFVGAIAVVISLIYLAVQVRRNTQQLENNERALLRSESGSQHEQWSGWRKMQINDPDLITVWLQGTKDPNQLDAVQRTQFDYLATELLYIITNVWERHQAGVAPEGAWEIGVKSAITVINTPGGALWWNNNKSWFYPPFVRDVEEALSTL